MIDKGNFYLSSLRNVEDLKTIAVEKWGFYPAQVNFITHDLSLEVKDKIKNKEVVGEFQNFKILYFKLDDRKKSKTQSIDQFLRSTSRAAINGIRKDKRQSNLYVFSDSGEDNWHFVAVDTGTGVLRLKRFVISPDNRNKLRTPCAQLAKLTIEESDTTQSVISKLEKAFSVESVSLQFFEEYKNKVFSPFKKFLYQQN